MQILSAAKAKSSEDWLQYEKICEEAKTEETERLKASARRGGRARRALWRRLRRRADWRRSAKRNFSGRRLNLNSASADFPARRTSGEERRRK